MKARNEPIGEVECPRKGCTAIAKVFRFRPRGAPDRKTVFSNKLYGDCPEHGRFGADGNQATHEYIREHAKLWESPSKGPAPVTAGSEKKPARSSPASTPEPTTPAAAPKTNGARWRPLLDMED